MSKPFNIHDWQDKQRQVSEIRAQDVPGTAAFMGKNMRGRGMSNSEKNKASVDAFFKDLRDKEEAESMSNADIGALDKIIKKYSMDKIMKTIDILKDRPLSEEENPVVAKGDGIEITQDEMEKLHRNGRVRLRDGSLLVFPSKPLNIKEDDIDEASATGTGASFNAGAGEGYMSPNAFGDDKKKKMKTYKSIGYKKV